jgi:hypothetical protein
MMDTRLFRRPAAGAGGSDGPRTQGIRNGGRALESVRGRLGWWLTLSRRAQAEAAATTDSEVVLLAGCFDYYPIAVNQSLRVHHSWFRAADGAVAPDDRLCAYDHQLLTTNLRLRGGFLQDGIEDSLRYFIFHERGFSCRYWRRSYGRLCFKNVENEKGSERSGGPSHARRQHRLVPKSALKWSHRS